MKLCILWLVGLLSCISACATEPGDWPPCPECDNTTELLVGFRCVLIHDIDPCGPDGHLHGNACHCFHDQQPVTIGDHQYCLQADCEEHEDEHDHD